MAEQPSPIKFEDVLLDEARRMGRGPCVEPMLYQALRETIPSLHNIATRLTRPAGWWSRGACLAACLGMLASCGSRKFVSAEILDMCSSRAHP